MALNTNFYEEIYEKENTWIDVIKSNLMNIYYLPELRDFYFKKQERLSYEFELTGNEIIKTFSNAISTIIIKIDCLINEDRKGNIVNINEICDYFLINKLNNNMTYTSSDKLNKITNNKNNLYELRKKIVDENLEDYIDDDFYYNKKAA